MSDLATPDPFLVHEAGPVAADGSQACARCQLLVLRPAPRDVHTPWWGYPEGRRLGQMPTRDAFYLLTPDRALAPDERLCAGAVA